MPYLTQRRTHDCTVVTLANYFGLEYDEVKARLIANGATDAHFDGDNGIGVPQSIWTLAFYSIKRQKTGLAGQKIKGRSVKNRALTGVARMYSSGSPLKGHLVCLIDGHVFDTTGLVYSLQKYRIQFDAHVQFVLS